MATALLILQIGLIVASCLLAWECVKMRRRVDQEEIAEMAVFNSCLQRTPKDFTITPDAFDGSHTVYAVYSIDEEKHNDTFVKLAVFATDDAEYNRLLASELIEKLSSKEGAR